MKITFPDGNFKEFPASTTGLEIAQSISISLAKKCIAVKISTDAKEWKLQDLVQPITDDCSVQLVTTDETDDSLELLRHSATHLMAQAVQELYPQASLAIGPVIDNGFYYDFDTKGVTFKEEDLPKIEKKMKEIALRALPITKSVMTSDEALKYTKDKDQTYKSEIIQDLVNSEQGCDEVSFYTQGDFTDMCRGPHLPNTKFIKHFKLTKVSGSYWKGDSENQQLQRIYGTAWFKESSMKEYLEMLEKAILNDHRVLAKKMDLFHQDQIATGDILWHPNGYDIFITLQNYIRSKIKKQYKEIKTPAIMHRDLWEKSGHWGKFEENMIAINIGDEDYAVKPMNCPGHIEVFKSSIRSYKDLPLSLSEFGCCARWEPSGALHGIMRLRSFTQDDAHIFCTPQQSMQEVKKFTELLFEVYKDFGFYDVKVKLSDRPEKRIGSDESWDIAEKALADALDLLNIEYTINSGEGAFYGPKLEFVLTDNLNRDWQCGTLQLDFFLPQRLDATYINEKSEKEHPIMIHRAILGSLERFIGILIEHHGGNLPLWLAPQHIAVCSFTDKQDSAAQEYYDKLQSCGAKALLDTKSETVNYKIRKHSEAKVPYIAVIGQQEIADNTITVRKLGEKGQKTMAFDDFIAQITQEIKAP